ncbi:MAG: NifU family protein [Flavobacteriaceae bacterium]|nr:NifU family protein [Flavobacteriaceae bacterium]|tara:strand:- start:65 stop:316 length:252 start_codon:yes stop_codon:yes gene_type:complete
MKQNEIQEKVLLALSEIRPFLASDGGDISLVSIEDNRIVNVQLHGACVGCSVNQMTLKTGVEMTIKKHVPQIEKVNSIEPSQS